MELAFAPIDARGSDRDPLIAFMSGSRFPFHVRTDSTIEDVSRAIDSGRYDGPDHAAFWIDEEDLGRIGVVVLEDLTDSTPMFDLRLAEQFRGRGYGVQVLRDLTALVFETFPEANRFEGQTREDNIAMRKTFLRAGFVKEAHYREGWPVTGEAPVASVAYAILRRDWVSGETTKFEWEDLRP